MKNVFLFLFTIFLFNISCSQKSKLGAKTVNYTIVDSLKYVSVIPDDYFYPKGDSICSKILSNYKDLTPLLIEKINDTINSKYKYADFYYYKVGDVAIELLSWGYSNSEFPLRKLLNNEFQIQNKNDQLNVIFYDLFHENTSEINFKNRQRFKIVVEKWFANKK